MDKGARATLLDIPNEVVVRILHFCTYKTILPFGAVGDSPNDLRFSHDVLLVDLQEIFGLNRQLD